MTKEDFDNIKAVVQCLRHDCSEAKNIKEALNIIANKTGLKIEIIKKILVDLGNKK